VQFDENVMFVEEKEIKPQSIYQGRWKSEKHFRQLIARKQSKLAELIAQNVRPSTHH
jgi:hypothetical protein